MVKKKTSIERVNASESSEGLGFPNIYNFLAVNKGKILRKSGGAVQDPWFQYFYHIRRDITPEVAAGDYLKLHRFYFDHIACFQAGIRVINRNIKCIIMALPFCLADNNGRHLDLWTNFTTRPLQDSVFSLKVYHFLSNDYARLLEYNDFLQVHGHTFFLTLSEFFCISNFLRKVMVKYNLMDLTTTDPKDSIRILFNK